MANGKKNKHAPAGKQGDTGAANQSGGGGANQRVADRQGPGGAPEDRHAPIRAPSRPPRTTRRTRSPRPARRRSACRTSSSTSSAIPPFLLPIYQAAGTQYGVKLGAAGRDQRDRDRLRPQPQRVLGRRARLDAVHAELVGDLRRGRQPGRREGPVQPGRRDLRRRALPEGGRRRQGHPRRGLRLQPRRLVRGLGAAARAGDRRAAGQPRRLAHGPDRGPLPGRREGDVRRAAGQGRAEEEQAQQPGGRRVEQREPARAGDLRRRRLAGGRGQRREGGPDRPLAAARALHPDPGRLRQHVHVRPPGQGLAALRRAEAAEASTRRRSSRSSSCPKPDAAPTQPASDTTQPASKAPRAPRDEPRRSVPAAGHGRAGPGRPSPSCACSRIRRAPTRRRPAATSRSSCAPGGSTAR